MELETIGAALGGVFAGGAAAAAGSAWWWGRQLKSAAQHIAKLDQARLFADQQNAQVRKQVDQMQHEMAELRLQASRTKPRPEVAPPPPGRQQLEDMLLRDAPHPTAAEPFPATQILPRKR